ncbi:MAG: hypothetical protein ACLR5T_00235 [Veillonella sp.]
MDVTQMYISEFVGTAVLLAFGNSTNASILLKKTIVGIFGTNWLHIIFGWAFAVAFGVYVGLHLVARGI